MGKMLWISNHSVMSFVEDSTIDKDMGKEEMEQCVADGEFLSQSFFCESLHFQHHVSWVVTCHGANSFWDIIVIELLAKVLGLTLAHYSQLTDSCYQLLLSSFNCPHLEP